MPTRRTTAWTRVAAEARSVAQRGDGRHLRQAFGHPGVRRVRLGSGRAGDRLYYGFITYRVLDCTTRQVIWSRTLNYQHGTNSRGLHFVTLTRPTPAGHHYEPQVYGFGNYTRNNGNTPGVGCIGHFSYGPSDGFINPLHAC